MAHVVYEHENSSSWLCLAVVSESNHQMLMFALGQGIVMFVQQNYQSRRVYALKTLGKVKELALDSSYVCGFNEFRVETQHESTGKH